MEKKSEYTHLLEPLKFGPIKIKNRAMMAALTRMRADRKSRTPKEIHLKYYTERAEDAGLILTECMAVSPTGDGFPGALDAYTNEHLEGLKKLTKEVHAVKGVIFAQLFHVGRASNSQVLGTKPVCSSKLLNRSYHIYEEPEELNTEGIKKAIGEFAKSIQLCKDAGFDGVEIHGANGYLVDEFLRDGCNKRTDEYGGSIENRCKFALEVIDEAIKIFDANRVGIKLSPAGRFNDMYDSDPQGLIKHLLPELNKRKILFIEIVRPPDAIPKHEFDSNGEDQWPGLINYEGIKKLIPDVLLVGNANFTPEEAEKFIKEKKVDLVSFGRNYMSNPDFCERLRNGWELAKPDLSKGWGFEAPEWGADGYCDYPKYKKI